MKVAIVIRQQIFSDLALVIFVFIFLEKCFDLSHRTQVQRLPDGLLLPSTHLLPTAEFFAQGLH